VGKAQHRPAANVGKSIERSRFHLNRSRPFVRALPALQA
jgi:hypothetical protein